MINNKYSEYIDISPRQFYRKIRTVHSEDVDKYIELNDFFKKSERYRLDYIFRAIVDNYELAYILLKKDSKKAKSRLDNIFNRFESIEFRPELAPNYFVLGNSYLVLDKIDKAIYCYSKVISTAEEEDSFYLASSYHNIGNLYNLYRNYDLSLEYMLKAHEIFDKIDKEVNYHRYYWIFNVCDIATIYYNLGDVEKGDYFYNLCIEKGDKNSLNYKNYVFAGLAMHYEHSKNNFEGVKKIYQELYQLLLKDGDYSMFIHYAKIYYGFAKDLAYDVTDIVLSLKDAMDSMKNNAIYIYQSEVLKIIIDYHISRGEKDLAKPYLIQLSDLTSEYEQERKKEYEELLELQFEKQMSISASEKIYEKKEYLESRRKKILKNKIHINDIYSRLSIIENISKNIINSSDIQEITDKLYDDLIKSVNIDEILLINIDKKEDKINLDFVYNYSSPNKNYTMSFDKNDEFIKELFDDKKIFTSYDISKDKECLEHLKKLNVYKIQYKSIIRVPIFFQDEIIAMIIVFCPNQDVCNEIKAEFIKQINIFMSIAINNVQKEKALRRLIDRHNKTKEKLEEASKYLSELSLQDSLTKIKNRRAFDEFYDKSVKKAREEALSLNIYMIDIDKFKHYNDTMGHLKGDEILIDVANSLAKNFKKDNQILARYGGEEFVGLSLGASPEEALDLGEKIRKSIEGLKIESNKLKTDFLTVSIGLASVKNVNNTTQYMKIADEALYKAKNSGRNCVKQIIELWLIFKNLYYIYKIV